MPRTAPPSPALPRQDATLQYPTLSTPPADAKLTVLKAHRRSLGLCYKCNAKWSKDHRCPPEVLHAVQALWDLCGDEEDDVQLPSSEHPTPTEQLCLAISKAAVTGVPSARTMQLMGYIDNFPVVILVDSGTSSSIINSEIADRLTSAEMVPLSVSVQIAGGGILHSSKLIKQLCWSVGPCSFKTDFRVLSLATFDVIVGMDWLESFSPMQIHWRQKWLAIPYQGQLQISQGITLDYPDRVLLQIEPALSADTSQLDELELPAVVHELLGIF